MADIVPLNDYTCLAIVCERSALTRRSEDPKTVEEESVTFTDEGALG